MFILMDKKITKVFRIRNFVFSPLNSVNLTKYQSAYPCRAVGCVSDCRYMSDCRSRGLKFYRSPVPDFVKIDHEIISTAIILPSTDSRRVVASYKRKYVHKVLVLTA